MDFIKDAIRDLHPPWKSGFISILVDDKLDSDHCQWSGVLDATAFILDVSPTVIHCEWLSLNLSWGHNSMIRSWSENQSSWWLQRTCFDHATVIQRNPLSVVVGQKAAIWSLGNVEACVATAWKMQTPKRQCFNNWMKTFDCVEWLPKVP